MSSPEALQWFKDHAQSFQGALLWDEPLSRHTYYRIGGPAKLLAAPKCQADLEWLSRGIRASGTPFWILGLGSNALVSDDGIDGLVIKTGRISIDISHDASGSSVTTGAGVAISSLLRRAAQEGWGGLEFLSGVPGSVGGAVAMNAGTHLGESGARLLSVEAFDLADGRPHRYEGAELRFEYRKNLMLSPSAVVTQATWRVDALEPAKVKAAIDETLSRRKATQPIDYPSCGSVFKNPRSSGKHAWQVIDELKLRGHRIGDAQFAEKHCNFIINLGSARAADVRALIELAKSRARSELGVELEEEVKYFG